MAATASVARAEMVRVRAQHKAAIKGLNPKSTGVRKRRVRKLRIRG